MHVEAAVCGERALFPQKLVTRARAVTATTKKEP